MSRYKQTFWQRLLSSRPCKTLFSTQKPSKLHFAISHNCKPPPSNLFGMDLTSAILANGHVPTRAIRILLNLRYNCALIRSVRISPQYSSVLIITILVVPPSSFLTSVLTRINSSRHSSPSHVTGAAVLHMLFSANLAGIQVALLGDKRAQIAIC